MHSSGKLYRDVEKRLRGEGGMSRVLLLFRIGKPARKTQRYTFYAQHNVASFSRESDEKLEALGMSKVVETTHRGEKTI